MRDFCFMRRVGNEGEHECSPHERAAANEEKEIKDEIVRSNEEFVFHLQARTKSPFA
jgi:hypothetical protein